MEITTNRDLYCFVAELVKERRDHPITLRAYLENLRRRCQPMRERDSLTLYELAEVLGASFDPPAEAQAAARASQGFLTWENCVTLQIQDLLEMEESGAIKDELRYFGVDAPRGARWYNFDPCTYLECGVAGTFGGWQDGDETGRTYVPGPVAVMDASGKITSVDPRELDEPVVEIAEVTWEVFVEFLEAGQQYE